MLTLTGDDIRQVKAFVQDLMSLAENEKVTVMQTLFFARKDTLLNPERHKLKELL
jgi:hypothetical protein